MEGLKSKPLAIRISVGVVKLMLVRSRPYLNRRNDINDLFLDP